MKQLIVTLILSSSCTCMFAQQEKQREQEKLSAEIINLFSGKIICGEFIPGFTEEISTNRSEHQPKNTSIEDIYWVLGNLFYYKTQPELSNQERTKRNNF